MDNKDFYNSASVTYNEMISFEMSLERKWNLFKNIVNTEMKNAADCGCGTGVDSIALSKAGLKVTAFDPSSEMITKAKTNANLYKVNVDFNNFSIHNIPDKFNNSFDLVLSLGNTFANIDKENFNETIKKCYEILRKGGTILIHILNYHKIIKEQNRIVNIKQGKDYNFIRFYDFEKQSIKFNILTYKQSNPSDYQLITTEILPHNKEDFKENMLNAGFQKIGVFSNMAYAPFDEEASKDLFILANT